MSRSRGVGLLLLPLVLALALVVVVPSSPSAATSSASSDETVRGWAAAPSAVRAGTVYAARVRVSGGSRPVALQRRVGTSWRTIASAGSTRTGLVLLRWTTPRSSTRVPLRVLAPRSGSRPTVVSRAKVVSVRRTLLTTVAAVLSPLLRDVLGLVNSARTTGTRCGGVPYPAVPRLRVETRLTRAATKYARAMATHDFFAHDSPGGSDPGERMAAEGYRWSSWGENIAAGYREADAVVQGWLESPGHCRNLMSAGFTEIGLGYAEDPDSTYGRYWVQDFARPQ